MGRFSELAFTPAVKAVQSAMGSRRAYARLEGQRSEPDVLGAEEALFLGERDSFYMASVGETGWPYVQHRGGPRGFVKVLDPHTLAFADLRGNRQYISVGNAGHDDRVALIFVDYPNRARLKVLAHAGLVTRAEDPGLFARVAGEAPAERVFVLRVEGLDWNCPQHITPRFAEGEIDERLAPVHAKLAALEAENRELRMRLSEGGYSEGKSAAGVRADSVASSHVGHGAPTGTHRRDRSRLRGDALRRAHVRRSA